MEMKDYDSIRTGDAAFFGKTITEADISAFCSICGDFNPLHVDESYAKNSMFGTRIAHGMLTASLIDYTLTSILGGGGIHVSQEIKFLAPVKIGDSIRVTSKVVKRMEEKRRLVIETVMENQSGTVVLEGVAVAMIHR